VKSRGNAYLPQPAGFDESDYAAYLNRTMFFEAVGRTIDGFVGAISRKDPTLNMPAAMEPVVEDATNDGLSLAELAKQLCAETILQGRVGILVDFDETKNRSYLSTYPTEAIINWSLDGVVLHETVYEVDPEDPFKQRAVEQYRQLSLTEDRYTVTIWRKKPDANQRIAEWIVFETITPVRRGKAFSEIPFFWVTPSGRTTRVDKPPLLGLVNICLSHYRNSADLEHGRHHCGCPTLWIAGLAPRIDDQPIRVGGTAAIILPDPQGKVGYAEFSGQGLGSLETALATKQEMMAVLGAQVFHDGPKGVEAAETARIRTSGETSLLSGVTTAVEETLEAAMQCAAEWMGVAGKVEITLNRAYVDTTLDGPTLTGLGPGLSGRRAVAAAVPLQPTAGRTCWLRIRTSTKKPRWSKLRQRRKRRMP
jgi:hypothetical protein